MVPSCMRGLPIPDGISLSILFNTSGEGPTHLKVTVKGLKDGLLDNTYKEIYIYTENYQFKQC